MERQFPGPAEPGDFYNLLALLPDDQQALLADVRHYLETDIAPVITEHSERAEFPAQIVPALAKMNLAGSKFTGYGCPGQGELFHGLLNVELARIDPSLAIFFGGHDGLGMGTIALCGSEEQKQRWLPPMARMEKIGAFALTEPDVGSDAARGLATTARRDGDTWVLNGAKKWIGNATFADLVVVWARDEADGQVKGFVVERGTPGFTAREDATARPRCGSCRTPRSRLDDCRVPEADRLQHANSFADTARVLRHPRLGWPGRPSARGRAPSSSPWPTPRDAPSSAGPSPASSWSRTSSPGCWPTPPPRSRCARGSPQLQDAGDMQEEQVSLAKTYITTPPARRSPGPARSSAATASCSTTTSPGYTNDAEAIYSFEGTREINSLIVGRALTGISAFV